jgi:hypothetical protein
LPGLDPVQVACGATAFQISLLPLHFVERILASVDFSSITLYLKVGHGF